MKVAELKNLASMWMEKIIYIYIQYIQYIFIYKNILNYMYTAYIYIYEKNDIW